MTSQQNKPSRAPASSAPRSPLPSHPLANLFDPLEGKELDELVGDIQRRGLRFPIITYKGVIIDGRNRALACARAGVEPRYEEFVGSEEDIPRFIISANIHRRHLKPEERRKLIKTFLQADPTKSDRQISSTLKVSPTTVGTIRAKMEKAGDVSKLDTRKDTRGRAQPAKKAAAKGKRSPTTPSKTAPAAVAAQPMPRTIGPMLSAPPSSDLFWDIDRRPKTNGATPPADQSKAHLSGVDLMKVLGVDASEWPDDDIDEACELVRRLSACDGNPGATKQRPQAIADWKAFLIKHQKSLPSAQVGELSTRLHDAERKVLALESENAELKAEVAGLRAEIAELRQQPNPADANDEQVEKLRAAMPAVDKKLN